MSSRYGLEIRAASSADAPGLFELLNAADHSITPRVLAERLGALRQEQGAVLIALERGPPRGLIVPHWYRILESGQPVAQISTVAPDGSNPMLWSIGRHCRFCRLRPLWLGGILFGETCPEARSLS